MAFMTKSNSIDVLVCTDGSRICLGNFDEVGEICWGHFWVRSGELYGYMNELGELICEPKYHYAGNFDRSMHAAVGMRNDDGKMMYTFIDVKGQELAFGRFDKVWYFNNGFAKVIQNGNVTYIDKLGQTFLSPYVERLWNDKPNRW